MVVYLVRHSKAVESHQDGDRYRPLSPLGYRRIESLEKSLREKGFKPAAYLSSPYLRAQETARAFGSIFGWAGEVPTSSSFIPDGDFSDALEDLIEYQDRGVDSLAVFSHNPFITDFCHKLLAPEGRPRWLEFHTPTVVCLDFPGKIQWGGGYFQWILHPQI